MPARPDWLWSCRCGQGGISDSEAETRRLAALHLVSSASTVTLSLAAPQPPAYGMPIQVQHHVFAGPVADDAQLPRPEAGWRSGWQSGDTGCGVSSDG